MRSLIESVKLVLQEEQFLLQLNEHSEQNTKIISHLSHVEDLGHEHGYGGTSKALEQLKAAHDHIKRGKHSPSLTTKVDGGVSVITGTHPLSGKRFVAYKGALRHLGTENETKIAYSHADVDKHFGDKPELAHKLKTVLDHAHKILPKHGVYQGDMLFTKDTVEHHPTKSSFTPNTITYSAKHGTAEHDKVKKAQLGISFHTKYSNRGGVLHSEPVNHEEFDKHDDVYHLSTANDTDRTHLSDEDSSKFSEHLKAAEDIHKKHGHLMDDTVSPLKHHVSSYVNKAVRTGETPNTKGLIDHVTEAGKKEFDKMKSEAGRAGKIASTTSSVNHINQNSNMFDDYFKKHNHLTQAKHILVKALDNADHPLEHHINGKKSHPEGYVFNHGGLTTKLVNRAEFSKHNFEKHDAA